MRGGVNAFERATRVPSHAFLAIQSKPTGRSMIATHSSVATALGPSNFNRLRFRSPGDAVR